MRSLGVLICVVLALAGCSKLVSPDIIHTGGNIALANSKAPLQIQFNGVTSFIIRYKESVVLTDPFVSNPSAGKVMFGKIHPDTAAIWAAFPQEDLDDTKMVVISHAHYDHLMDLPPLLPRLSGTTIIGGSKTTEHILAAAQPKQKVVGLNTIMGSDSTLGKWVYSADSTVRTMAFESGHPPHFLGITLFPGPYREDLKEIPNKSKKWKRGQPLSYIIDFLENGMPVYRIYSQSSSAHGNLGLFPQGMLTDKPIDVVLISQAVHGKETSYTEAVMARSQAPIVFFTHWENFFRKPTQPLKSVPKAKVEHNYHYLQASKDSNTVIILPKPGSRYLLGK